MSNGADTMQDRQYCSFLMFSMTVFEYLCKTQFIISVRNSEENQSGQKVQSIDRFEKIILDILTPDRFCAHSSR